MGASQDVSSLTFEISVIRAKNLEFVSVGSLFLRYYLPNDEGKRLRVSSREIPSTCNPCWNEAISLKCPGAEDVLDKMKHQSIVVELRWRKVLPVLGKFGRSKLLCSAEIGWNKVLDSTDLAVREWVASSVTSKHVPEGLKQPALQIEMKIQDWKALKLPRKCHMETAKWRECGCRHGGCSNIDVDTWHSLQH